MKKLIIQIPCLNEEEHIGHTLASLPRAVPGFDQVELLVIDDGSSDNTVAVARAAGADHVVSLSSHQGLARAFIAGLDRAVELGADVIVNTDADNQYCADDIPQLTLPVLEGRADMVVGERPIESIGHFSAAKKRLQRLGSWVVRAASGTQIPDAPSGFRALSADAARRLNIFSNYTYTLETIIQTGHKNMSVLSVPVRTNAFVRPSRLMKSTLRYVWHSLITIVRIFVVYRPFRFFMTVGGVLFGIGLLIGIRFLYYFMIGGGEGKVQSLILASILLGIGFQNMLVAFMADLLSVNRRLIEDVQYRLRCGEVYPRASGEKEKCDV
ncbi:MAG TPA: glycosyltransferase family 2 protein [Kiritimatiellia bacterium]|nr:glycosyltransferase family 2 protein [Kiritimatiellia bacterium]